MLFLNKNIRLLLRRAPPEGVANFMILGIENYEMPSHYDLHKTSIIELKFFIEYQYNTIT